MRTTHIVAIIGGVTLVAAAAGGVLLARAGTGGDNTPIIAQPSPTDDPVATPSPVETPSTSPAPSPAASPAPSPSPSPSPSPTPEPPKPDPEVKAAQEVLAAGHYYLGAIDGLAGPATNSAVMAFQKVNGLSADGVIGPNTLAALEAPVTPTLHGGAATRVEVDLTKQVAYLVKGGELVRIMPISSGSGETYTTASGGQARSLTPVGAFKVQRRIEGIREAPLGILYDPLYFHRGWALHGSNHVPAYPASHGCVRLTRWDAVWLAGQIPNGTQVLLYGGTHTFRAGEELTEVGTTEPGGDTGGATEEPSESPSPSPSPSASPSPTPTPTPTPTPSPSPSASPSPSPSPSPSASPSPAPSGSPSPSPTGSDSGT